ncbi:MAG: cytochrome c biogenesis protein [Candidatus Latescibacterota bacterium]
MHTRLANLFAALVCVAMLAALAMVFLYVPTEQTMGPVQRIFYFHVPSAVCSFIAFFLVSIGSLAYLKTRREHWDRLARCAAELGVVFALIVLITGPLWGKPAWGVYWRWEPRLTSMLILFAMYVTYLMVRSFGAQTTRTPQLAAVLGVLAFANVPLVYYSVNLWAEGQQLHPRRVSLPDPAMVHTLYVCFAAFFLLFAFLLQRRLALAAAEAEVATLRHQLAES